MLPWVAGEVALRGRFWAAWREERAPARGVERRGTQARRVEATRSRRWRGEAAQSGGGRRGTVGRRGKQSRQAGEEDRDLNAISKNFRGITVKQG